MSSLTEFLLENPIDDITAEIILSERLKDFKFKIRPMNSKEFNSYTKRATVLKNNKLQSLNADVFNELIVLNHTLEPNFRDADLLSKSGAVNPESLLNKVLLAGEITELANKITELSGFGQTIEESIEEAKN